MIKYIILAIIGGVIVGFTDFFHYPDNPIGLIGAFILCIGFYGGIICLWFRFLKLFYPKATNKRMWGVTGYIFWIIVVIALCFTGIGAASLITLKHPIRGLIPTDSDK